MMVHDFKPETDEEKKAKKAEIEANRVFKSVTYKEATARISELILKTVYHKKFAIDQNSPMILGQVHFWVTMNEGSPMLMYNKHPSTWDKDAVILELEQEEYALIQKGNQY